MKLNIYEMLDVEEDEVFELNGYKYKIMQGQIYGAINGNISTWEKITYALHLLHEAEFERIPFVPKIGEFYYSVETSKSGLLIDQTKFCADCVDIVFLELGLCYRTEKQAIEEGIPKMKALIEKWGGKCE